jgi:hypothetical protein
MDDSKGLLVQMQALQVTANRAEMARARRAAELFQHFSADHLARKAADAFFTLTPLAELVTEVEPVTGQTPGRIRSELEQLLIVDDQLPWLAEHLDEGRIDLYRVRPVTDAVREDLQGHPEALARFAELMQTWFAAAGTGPEGLITKTVTQIRHRVHYVLTKVLAGEMDDRFKKRHRQRRVTATETGDGMAALTIDTDAVSVKLAETRLDLLARHFRNRGDERTLEQLRTDLAIGLLTGTGPDTLPDQQVGRWARPVINVTVPIQTLMGLSDEPGMLGEQVLPASLVRHVAADPNATWYRLLTDPHRRGVELSTTSYRPTGPISREVVAVWSTCLAPTCPKPAGECELDHNTPHPDGETRTGNLGPGCKRHHTAKHGPGASLKRGRDGTLRYRLRSGMTHLVSPPEVPICDDPDVGHLWHRLLEIQPNLAELTTALDELAASQHKHAEHIIDQAEELTRLEADYRASYPGASEEDIDHWVWGEEHPDPQYDPPPITRKARFTFDQPPEDHLSTLIR